MHSLTKKILAVVAVIVLSIFGCQLGAPYKPQLNQAEKDAAARMSKTVDYLVTYLGVRDHHSYTSLNTAADHIAEQFMAAGYIVAEQSYEVGGKKFRNLIAYTGSHDPAKELVLVGAHYDSMDNPGADDNASGVAAMLELARQLRGEPAADRIKFIAFTNEEPPFFQTPQMGSQVYVKHAWEAGERLKLAVILEMVGYYTDAPFSQRYPVFLGPFYPSRGNFIAMVTNYPSRNIASRFYKLFKKSSDFPARYAAFSGFAAGVDWSDHSSFWQKDYPAVMLTDTAFYRNPNYHKPTDVAETLDYHRMAKLVSGLKKALVALVAEP